MLSLSNDILNKIEKDDLDGELKTRLGVLQAYYDDTKKMLQSSGYLNVVLVDNQGEVFGFSIEEFKNSPVTVKFQEQLKQINASTVMNMKLVGDCVEFFHRNGFLSVLDQDTMKVLSQEFTK